MHADPSNPVTVQPRDGTQLTDATPTPPPVRDRLLWPAAVLVMLLVLSVPLFLRMPLTNDAVLFDLQARLLGEGDVLYREMLEPNFPGVVWLHYLVRAVGGWSSETLRFFDLLLLAITLTAARYLLRQSGVRQAASLWTLIAAATFYLSASEWIHCQRDIWMLAPVFVAGRMRTRAIGDNESQHSAIAFVEGVIWGCGVWIKPYVLLIGLACWLVGICSVTNRRRYLLSTLPLVAGGAVIGAAGIGWLVVTGAWPHFMDTLRVWNPQYLAAGREHWTAHRLNTMAARFSPWFWLHLPAVLLAVRSLTMRTVSGASSSGSGSGSSNGSREQAARRILSAIYVASLLHGFGLQHLFDYVHGPLIVIAILVCGAWAGTLPQRRLVMIVCGLFAVLAIKSSALRQPDRLKLWSACATSSSTVEQQDKLSHFTNPRRADLERVAQFLESQGVSGRDVGCFNSDCVWLYQRLKVHPPSRFIYVYENSVFFPSAHETMQTELAQSGHRYVVSDLVSCGMSRGDAEAVGPGGPQTVPPKYRVIKGSYPWSHPVVFRAGTYLVHEVRGPIGKFVTPKK